MAKKGEPERPDPIKTADIQTKANIKTAKAQTKQNIKTAAAQSTINNVNQVTPGGSLTYTKTVDKNGVPQWTATTALSKPQQQIYDTGNEAALNLAQVAKAGSAALETPFSLDNDATEARLMELGRKRLDPILSDRSAAIETDLINRGIRPGSDNYDRAIREKYQAENDAYDQLALTGRQQAVSEALAGRNQLINEVNAARSGSQVQTPNFVSTPQSGVSPAGIGGVDVAGLITNDYNQRLAQYQQQQSDMWGGLFGLGKAAIGLF